MPANIPTPSKFSREVEGYTLGLTSSSLLPELARIVAENYLSLGDWELAKERILASNALQCRSANSAIRLERELRQRLGRLTQDQIIIAAQATAGDRAAIAWLAVCKSSRFAFEFASDVLREKFACHDVILRPSDYEAYVENKSLTHPELGRLTPISKSKVRQVLLRMLVEAGMLVPGKPLGTLQRPTLSPNVMRAILGDNPGWLAGFLVPDSEIANRQTP